VKKFISVLLVLIILCLSVGTAAFAKETSSGFVPVMRFVAASDTHVKSNDATNEQRIGKMMKLAYSIADNDPVYKKLDALLIAGDLTNDGTKDEFDRFGSAVKNSLRDGTQFLGVVAKNHDGYEMKRAELRSYYKNLMGVDADFHTVIGGYHFIGISASEKDSKHYDAGQKKWLKQQLDIATADDPEKPVFVMHHEHVRNTVYGSSTYDGWGKTAFTSILKKYPQVVDFSGHSHYPLNDPRSIWQGKFTAIGTGAIYYSEFTVERLRSYHPEDSGETATCWIVELDAQNNMRLRGYDVLAGKMLCEEILKNPAKSENRDFTPEKRKADSVAPSFDENAEIEVNCEYGKCTLTVPAASCADGKPVVLYRAAAKDRFGTTAAKTWVMPSYYRAVDEESFTLELTDLPAGTYKISVTAENAYGIQSEALKTEVTLDGGSEISGFFARIQHWFKSAINFIVELFV
jgi:hypothetical protein